MGKVISFFNHPLVGILGSISGVIGLVLAVIFYYAGQREPRLTYSVYPLRAPVVQTGKMSALKVLINGVEIQGDVTAAQIAIWNSGAAPIKSEDILTPILIQTENNAPILDVSVRKVSRPVIEMSLDQSKISSGIVGVHWRILEQNDGCVLQIIYLGSTSVRLSMTADIVGQKSLQELRPYGTISNSEGIYYRLGGNIWRFTSWSLLAFGSGTLIGGIVSCFRGAKQVSLRNIVSGFVISLLYIGLGIWMMSLSVPEPPFGF